MSLIAIFGGVYSNYLALETAIADARRRGAVDLYCLGDLGAFGPHPNRVFPLLEDNDVHVVQGNYDDSIGRGLPDCQCGYTDARDNHFAAISYRYTHAHTDPRWRPWLRDLPKEKRLSLGDRRVLMCHGSPRATNEFLWESTTSDAFLQRLFTRYETDVILTTHTGLKWQRELASGCLFANVGVLGRPENDGSTRVWYALAEADASRAAGVRIEFVPVAYDHERLAREMEQEDLPAEFIETIRCGWWTTCLEILPARERSRGRH